jgi:hypothetical protein
VIEQATNEEDDVLIRAEAERIAIASGRTWDKMQAERKGDEEWLHVDRNAWKT